MQQAAAMSGQSNNVLHSFLNSTFSLKIRVRTSCLEQESLMNPKVSNSCVRIYYNSCNLLESGDLQSFVDFFYVTTETTPSEIEPSSKLKEEQRYNKRSGKIPFIKNQESLL